MKILLIIFLIVVCLLSFVGISYSNKDILSPGESWKTTSDGEHCFYIAGFQQGIQRTFTKLSPTIEKFNDGGKVWDELVGLSEFLWEIDVTVISKVMDDLYKDPANTYIYVFAMINIAYHKLKGEDVEPILQKAREEGLQIFKEKEGNE